MTFFEIVFLETNDETSRPLSLPLDPYPIETGKNISVALIANVENFAIFLY